MEFLRDLSVRWKLLGLAGILVAFMVLSGLLGIVNISSSAAKGDDLYRNATVPIERLESVETGLRNVYGDLVKSFSARTGAAQYRQAFSGDATALEHDLNAYRSNSLTGTELADAQQFASDWSAYRTAGQSVVALAAKGDSQAANRLYFTKAASLNGQLDQELSRLIKINDTQAGTDVQAINANKSSSTTLT
ncbi:MAG: MCP four helix bundle domain-containing protein, partial [Solirubrobacteraceae bacterium]